MRARLACSLLVLVAACDRRPPASACNPLIGDDCLTPFPSSFFLEPDPSTRTGVRVHVPVEALPLQAGSGGRLLPERLNHRDGFSPATPFVIYFRDGVDPLQLPGADTLERSLSPSSPVQVIDATTGERVPTMAELDAHGESNGRQALLIRPLTPLAPATRYLVALVGLHDRRGRPLAPAPFVSLRDGKPSTPALMALAPRYHDLFATLERFGVPRQSLTLAWDVITSSDPVDHLLHMRDEALSLADQGQLRYAIASRNDPPNDPLLLRELEVKLQVPWFLDADDQLVLDGNQQPKRLGARDISFWVHVPTCARTATQPLPVVVAGHALLANARDTLRAEALERFAQRACAVFIATDWLGLATDDVQRLADILPSDFNRIYAIPDRLQQAHVDAQVMTHLFATRIKDDPALTLDGRPITDGKQVYYFGVSNGGIQGAAFLALSKEVERGVLDVAGAGWSLMLLRCADFGVLLRLLARALPDPLDLQIALTMLQSDWDYTDASTFAPHLLAHPLSGAASKHVLVHESMGDAEVSNLATEMLARAIGLPVLSPIEPVLGVVEGAPPLDSALTQWDVGPRELPPRGDTALAHDNGAHTAIYGYPPAQDQVMRFFRPDGAVVDVCHGRCTIGF